MTHACTGADCAHPDHAQPKWTYAKGLHDLGDGCYAYLQPDGSWGWSNAGFVRDGDQSLLVDTLFDTPLTETMLGAIADATGVRAGDIQTLVNTHANGDHTFGNGLVTNAEIIASAASAAEMEDHPPAMLAQMLRQVPGETGAYLNRIFGAFDFDGAQLKSATRTFDGRLTLKVGDKTVDLYQVGPCHTAGDVIVHAVEDGIVYTGDILFIDGTPIMWAGPVANWLKACDLIADLKPNVIVPGHGPITDLAGVARVADYLRHISTEARRRFDSGLSVTDAALDISLGSFADWGDAERIAVNVATLYREFGGAPVSENPFSLMAALASRGPKR